MSDNHSHELKNYNNAFAIGVALNLIFVVIEAGYGIASDSLALIADAGHNLSDVFALFLAWGANFIASKKPTEKRTYGFKKITVMASLISAILLLVALGGIAVEALGRFDDPQPVHGMTVILVALIGVVINTATAFLFVSGQKHDLNIKGAFLHMAADAGVSLGVALGGVLILFTGALWLDPAISLLIVAVILVGTWHLLRDSVNLSLDAAPSHIDIAGIKRRLTGIKAVCGIHDLHIWGLSASETALTVHLVVTRHVIDNEFLWDTQKMLHDQFGIDHATIQVEAWDENTGCMINCDDCQ